MTYIIRQFRDQDARQIATLFYDTVHAINVDDYTEQQIGAWAPKLSGSQQVEQINRFTNALRQSTSYVADYEGTIIGFADISDDGYLDFMYVHKDHQRQGVASAMLMKLEEAARKSGVKQIWTHASITAKPFFEHFGYSTVRRQTVTVRSVKMDNFRMQKTI